MTEQTEIACDTGSRTWSEVLAGQAENNGGLTALVDDYGARLDYRRLHREVGRAAAMWQQAGVRPGDRVAILGRNSVEFAVNLFGLSRAGAIPLLLNWRLTPDELRGIAELTGPTAIVHDPDFDEGARAVVPDGPRFTMHDAPRRTTGDPGRTTAELRAQLSGDTPIPDARTADYFALLHTSGTTGLPKVVPLTHAGILRGCRVLAVPSGQRAGDVHLRFTPHFHLAGLQELGSALLTAGVSYLHTTFDPERWVDAVDELGVNFGCLPPAALAQVVACVEARTQAVDLTSLHEIWYGTAPAGPELVTSAARVLSCGLRQIYGMTEAQIGVAVLTPDDHREGGEILAGAGRPLPDWEVAFRTPDGTVEAGRPHVIGELLIRGPYLFDGYWNLDGRRGAGVDDDGWYATGDIAKLGDDGRLRIVDRAKDMIVSGGENVYPAEVEARLSVHPDVAEISCIGIPDAQWGEVVHAVVVPRAEAEFDADAFLTWSRTRIAGFKRPRSVEVAAALPRNATGKILKRAMRDSYRNAGIAAPVQG